MISCRLFGHVLVKAYASDAAWGRLSAPYHDGIGRAHRNVYGKCERCGATIIIAKTIDELTFKAPGETS